MSFCPSCGSEIVDYDPDFRHGDDCDDCRELALCTSPGNAVLNWLANSENRGLSSVSLAFASLGVDQSAISYPLDPSDLNRCLVLMEASPKEVRSGLRSLAKKSVHWNALFENWDELDRVFVADVGWTPGKGWQQTWKRAHDTYEFMQELYKGLNDEHL